MKNNIIKWGVIAIAVLAIIGVISSGFILRAKNKELDKHLVELNMSELKEKIENKDTFILVITQTTCSHCAEYKPTLKKVLYKYDIVGYFIEEDKLSKQELGELKEIANTSGTPQTIFIKDGAEESTSTRLSGNQQEGQIISRLKAMGYIKE